MNDLKDFIYLIIILLFILLLFINLTIILFSIIFYWNIYMYHNIFIVVDGIELKTADFMHLLKLQMFALWIFKMWSFYITSNIVLLDALTWHLPLDLCVTLIYICSWSIKKKTIIPAIGIPLSLLMLSSND